MFPVSSKHKGQAVAAFPDVCKTPVPLVGAVPTPYPNIGTTVGGATTATKPAYATKPTSTKGSAYSKSSGDEAGQLKGKLSTLHQKLMTLQTGDATAWHATLDEYVMTTAAIYNVLTSNTR